MKYFFIIFFSLLLCSCNKIVETSVDGNDYVSIYQKNKNFGFKSLKSGQFITSADYTEIITCHDGQYFIATLGINKKVLLNCYGLPCFSGICYDIYEIDGIGFAMKVNNRTTKTYLYSGKCTYEYTAHYVVGSLVIPTYSGYYGIITDKFVLPINFEHIVQIKYGNQICYIVQKKNQKETQAELLDADGKKIKDIYVADWKLFLQIPNSSVIYPIPYNKNVVIVTAEKYLIQQLLRI